MTSGAQNGEMLARSALLWSVMALLCCGVLLGPFSIYRATQAFKALGPGPSPARRRAITALSLAIIAILAWLFFILPLALLVASTQGSAIVPFLKTLL